MKSENASQTVFSEKESGCQTPYTEGSLFVLNFPFSIYFEHITFNK